MREHSTTKRVAHRSRRCSIRQANKLEGGVPIGTQQRTKSAHTTQRGAMEKVHGEGIWSKVENEKAQNRRSGWPVLQKDGLWLPNKEGKSEWPNGPRNFLMVSSFDHPINHGIIRSWKPENNWKTRVQLYPIIRSNPLFRLYHSIS